MSCLSLLSVLSSVMIEHLEICHDWISWFDLINPIIWFNLISSILWSDLISLISWLYLITLTRIFFSSTPRGRWLQTLPITLRRIWLVRPRPHAKYISKAYPYIPYSFSYSNPIWTRNRGLVQTWVSIILSISCVDFIVICIYSFLRRVTPPPPWLEVCEHHTVSYIYIYTTFI